MPERIDLRGPFSAAPVKPPAKPSQSLLHHLDSCSYAGMLYLKYGGGGAASHAMARGSAFHHFAERATRRIMERAGVIDPDDLARAREMSSSEEQLREWLQEQGVATVQISVDEARDLMQQVIKQSADLVVPTAEQDALRAMAWNFATGHVIDPTKVVALETMLELEIDGWTVRGKLDRAELVEHEAFVHDYKTSRNVQSKGAYEKSFQPQFYALLVAQGVYAAPEEDHPQLNVRPEQYGKRVTEKGGPVHTYELYPRYTYQETGDLVNNEATYTQAQLADFKETLRSSLARLEHGLETNMWAAVPSSHCAICPSRADCPLPAEIRDEYPRPSTEEEARELAQWSVMFDHARKGINKNLKAWASESGVDIDLGNRYFTFKKVEQIRDERVAVSTRFQDEERAA